VYCKIQRVYDQILPPLNPSSNNDEILPSTNPLPNNDQILPPLNPSPNSLDQRKWKLYLDGEECDATIKVKSNMRTVGKFKVSFCKFSMYNTSFQVHRGVFIAKSEAFRTLFSASKKVKINDSSVSSVDALIRWIYLSEIKDQAIVEELYYLGHKYMLVDLKVSIFL
jgi:hypothetical protein